MLFDAAVFGSFITLLIIAMALGMDAFSLGLSMGVRGVGERKAYTICLMVAFFHFTMPVIGIMIGHLLNELMGTVATFVGGAFLLAVGLNMIFSGFEADRQYEISGISFVSIVLLAFIVSIDSLSAGFSLGLLDVDALFTASLLGTTGGAMAGVGLVLGRFMNHWLADYGELVGGTILVVFGLKFLF